jgi:hypothetical protein
MRKAITVCSLLAALAVATATTAATECSIHPAKDATDAQLAALAKVSQADAEKKGLAHAKQPAKIVGSALQVEGGCLLWMLIVKHAGSSGTQSLRVDAGTGKMLSAQKAAVK